MAEKDILTGQDKDTLIQGHDADGITEFDIPHPSPLPPCICS